MFTNFLLDVLILNVGVHYKKLQIHFADYVMPQKLQDTYLHASFQDDKGMAVAQRYTLGKKVLLSSLFGA